MLTHDISSKLHLVFKVHLRYNPGLKDLLLIYCFIAETILAP